MHRVGKKADWELVEPGEWNIFQKFANKTNGKSTPANLVSLAGLTLTIQGARNISKKNDVKGIVQILLGRGLDVVDGVVADKTGTKSPLGEAVDATFDKIAVASCLPALHKRRMVNHCLAGALVVQNSANVALTFIAKARDQEIHPDKSGKDAAMLSWCSAGTQFISKIANEKEYLLSSVVLQAAGNYLQDCYVRSGIEATAKYTLPAFGPKNTDVSEPNSNLLA